MLSTSLTLAVISAASVIALPHAAGPADLASNHAYRSPSLNVDALRVNTDHIYNAQDRRRWSDTYQGNLTFPYGVASGDPYSDSVILWTMPRKFDSGGLYGGNAWPPICLQWVVSATPDDFAVEYSVQNGYVKTTEDVRFAVKVEATALQPYTQYYYRFQSCEGPDLGVSPVGAFKTLPAEDAEVDRLRLAVFSCSNLPFGYFTAYKNAAGNADRLDYIQHVGDYIYEYKNGDYGNGTALDRAPVPDREISSLQDYRDRYAQYRSDVDLQELHRKLAWQTVWDDHEVADNSWAHGSADSNDTIQGQVGDYQFSQRKANAVRAYYEWMPIRQVETDDKLRIWRSFKLGKLADMIMLDTRQYDRSITDLYYNTPAIIAAAGDEDRSLTGPKQEAWLFEQLRASKERGATWPLLMQQIVFSRVNYSIATGGATEFNVDAWEGYRAQRDRILEFIEDEQIQNTVVLSGDSHATWVSDLRRDNESAYEPTTGAGGLGVEFAGSAVSSPSSYGYGPTWTTERYNGVAANLTAASPSLQYAEGQLRGYFELELTPQNATAFFYGFTNTTNRDEEAILFGTFSTEKGSNRLSRPLNGGVVPDYGALGAGARASGNSTN